MDRSGGPARSPRTIGATNAVCQVEMSPIGPFAAAGNALRFWSGRTRVAVRRANMRRTVLYCGAMSAFRGVADITARGDSSRSVANDPQRTLVRAFDAFFESLGYILRRWGEGCEAARAHCFAWWYGRLLASRSMGAAAAGKTVYHRVLGHGNAFGHAMDRCFCRTTARIGLD